MTLDLLMMNTKSDFEELNGFMLRSICAPSLCREAPRAVNAWRGRDALARVEATFAIDHVMLQASEPSVLQRLLRQLEVADQRREPRSRWRAATVMSADRAMEILVAREIHDSQFWDDAGSRSRESIRASIADTLALLSIRLNTMNVTTPSAYTLPENWHLVKDHQGHVFFKNIVTGVESDTRPETPQR